MRESTVATYTLSTIEEFSREYAKYPNHFMIENDIQSILMALLRKKINRTITFTNYAKTYSLETVYSEYPYRRGKGPPRIDICILDSCESFSPNFNDPLWMIYLPILIGIEIKCFFDAAPIDTSIKKILRDFKKVSSIRGLKYFICLGFSESALQPTLNKVKQEYQIERVDKLISYGSIYIIAPDGLFTLKSQV